MTCQIHQLNVQLKLCAS